MVMLQLQSASITVALPLDQRLRQAHHQYERCGALRIAQAAPRSSPGMYAQAARRSRPPEAVNRVPCASLTSRNVERSPSRASVIAGPQVEKET